MKSILEYKDYRLYIQDYYDERKRLGAFSWREFCNSAGFSSPNFLQLVCKGESKDLPAHIFGQFVCSQADRGIRIIGKLRTGLVVIPSFKDQVIAWCYNADVGGIKRRPLVDENTVFLACNRAEIKVSSVRMESKRIPVLELGI